jgi:hypothetical protein
VIRTNPSLLQAGLRRDLAIMLLREHLIDMMFGLGPIGDLMQIADVNDIMVLPSGHIFIERRGRMQDSGRKMLSSDAKARCGFAHWGTTHSVCGRTGFWWANALEGHHVLGRCGESNGSNELPDDNRSGSRENQHHEPPRRGTARQPAPPVSANFL